MSSNKWQLDKTLANDSLFIADLKLSQLRLINNSLFPWVILIPRTSNSPIITEIIDLSDIDYLQLCTEIKQITHIMKQVFIADKINIASIGNIVSQLHIHIIARYRHDSLFPKVSWGSDLVPYNMEDANHNIALIKTALIGKE
jgi:diadenosine tetraphosphate (Ap4A) HIT family hydrolase